MSKSTFFLFLFLTVSFSVSAQRIQKVVLGYDGSFKTISVITADGVILNISAEGTLSAFGVEYISEKYANIFRLENYTGRVEYYSNADNAALRGKPRYIGTSAINYFTSYESEALQGKIKSVGNVIFDYYREYDDEFLRGRIRTIGRDPISWYASFDNDALRGKLKTVGIIPITYYSSFDDTAFRGKVKSISNNVFTYYSSYERQYAGAMKNAVQFVFVNGINFYFSN